jgi:PAS domain S-box-containing protein
MEATERALARIKIHPYEQELNRIKSFLKGSHRGYTVTEISRSIEINRNSVAKYLDVLRTMGIVDMKLVGSAKVFSLTKRIPIASILSLSSDYIFVLDEDFIVTYVNENVLNFEKKQIDDIVGKPVDSIGFVLLSILDIGNILDECILGKDILKEIEIKNDGQISYFRAKFVPSILETGKRGILIILDDITEIKQYQRGLEKAVKDRNNELTHSYTTLKKEIKSHKEIRDAFEESERKYQTVIELAQEGILTCDADGNTSFVNHKMSEILGYAPEEMLGKPLFVFVDQKSQAPFKENFAQLKKGKIDQYELNLIRKDGTIAFTRISVSPRIDEYGQFIYGLFVVSDITELKNIEAALRQSENYYRTIIQTSPNGIVVFDLNGTISVANLQAVKLLSHSKANVLLGKNIFDYFSPDDLEKFQVYLKKIQKENTIKTVECTLISKNNLTSCAELMISVLIDSSQNTTHIVCVMTDITERRKADYLVKKSETMYRRLVEGISHIIFTTDLKGRFTYISPVIQKVLGYTPEELLGKHFYVLVTAEDRHKLGLKIKEAQSGKFSPNDFKLIDKMCNPHWVRIIAQPHYVDNKLAGITGLIGDIDDWKLTEDALQKCELQYKAVVDDQSDLICRFSPEFLISFVNPAFCRYYHKKPEEWLNKNFLSTIPEKSHTKLLKRLSALTMDHSTMSFDHEVMVSDGNVRWHHLTIRALFDMNGELFEFQSSSRDLTELKLYFEQSHKLLQDAQIHQIELERQNEELGQLRQEAEYSEQKYLDLYNYAPVGYFTLDAKSKIIEVNQTGSMLIGLSRHQLLNTSFKDFISEEDLAEFAGFCIRIFETNKKQTCEIVLKRYENSPVAIQIEGKAIENTIDHVRQYRIVVIDITDRKRSNNALKEIESRLKSTIPRVTKPPVCDR